MCVLRRLEEIQHYVPGTTWQYRKKLNDGVHSEDIQKKVFLLSAFSLAMIYH